MRLTEVYVDFPACGYTRYRWESAPDEVFIPLRPTGKQAKADDSRIRVILSSKRPERMDLVRRLNSCKDETAALRLLLEHREALVPKEPIEGVVGTSSTRDDKLRKIFGARLHPGYVVLSEGSPPTVWVCVQDFGLGLALFLIAGYLTSRKQK